jgi:hypothetical protein
MTKRQRGVTTVEFSIAGTALLLVLFAVLEIGRALFAWNTIIESTRRGARVAAVCPPNDPAIGTAAVFSGPGGGSDSPILDGLSTGNVTISYFDAAGVATAGFPIDFVRVEISGYAFQLIPLPLWGAFGIDTSWTMPPFATTLPAESLGWVPEDEDRSCLMPP